MARRHSNTTVYDDLSHPLHADIGAEYQYRTTDGSYNNICDPVLLLIIASLRSVFRTSHNNVSINEVSSYVALGPRYGSNKETVNRIGAHDGRGMMLPNTFSLY